MAAKFMNGIDLQNQRGVNAADPTNPTDLATKQYTDNLVNGLQWKRAARAATTASGTLASAYVNGSVIDGVTLATGDRVLIKNQSTASENGIYTVNASGAPTRATDADGAGEIGPNTTLYVSEGTTQADTAWTVTNNGAIVIGTTALVFAQVPSSGGGGVSDGTKGDIIVSGGGTVYTVNPASGFIKKVAANIGDGSTLAIVVTHNMNTQDVQMSCQLVSTKEQVYPDMVATSVNTATYTFAAAPATGAYRAIIQG